MQLPHQANGFLLPYMNAGREPTVYKETSERGIEAPWRRERADTRHGVLYPGLLTLRSFKIIIIDNR